MKDMSRDPEVGRQFLEAIKSLQFGSSTVNSYLVSLHKDDTVTVHPASEPESLPIGGNIAKGNANLLDAWKLFTDKDEMEVFVARLKLVDSIKSKNKDSTQNSESTQEEKEAPDW